MTLNEFIKNRQSSGKYTFTARQVLEATGISRPSFYNAVSRLKKSGRLIHPKQGFYVIVRLEEKASGGPSPVEYIDELMGYLSISYYVGVLSAAQLHGAAHHSPRVFQVVVDKNIRPVDKSDVNIQFICNRDLQKAPLVAMKTRAGFVKVSSGELTALDVLYYRKSAGGLNNAVNIIIELARENKLAPERLLETALNIHDRANLQRLGYILEKFEFSTLVRSLSDWCQKNNLSRVPLSPSGPRSGVYHDKKWDILVNVNLDPDVV